MAPMIGSLSIDATKRILTSNNFRLSRTKVQTHDPYMKDTIEEWDLRTIAPTVVSRAPEAIIVADRKGAIRLWNAGAERLFGHAEDEAIGQSLDLIIPQKHRERHWAGWQRVLAGGTPRYGPEDVLSVPGIRRDGSRMSLEFSVFLIEDPVGEIKGIGAVLRDVTRRFEETKELRRRLAEAEASGTGTS